MEVILLKKVENLGNLGDKVTVKAGYGRNFLMPTGKAKAATVANIAEFEAKRAELEAAAAKALAAAEARASKLTDLTITIASKAGDEGKLFGSIGAADIAAALADTGIEIEKQEVRLPEGPIRVTGEIEVGIHLHTDVDAVITIVVVAED